MLDASLWSMALVKKINSLSVRLTKVYFSDSGIKLKARDGLFEVAIRIYKSLRRLLRIERRQQKRSDSGGAGHANCLRSEEVTLCIGRDYGRKRNSSPTHHNMNPIPHARPLLPSAIFILDHFGYGPWSIGCWRQYTHSGVPPSPEYPFSVESARLEIRILLLHKAPFVKQERVSARFLISTA